MPRISDSYTVVCTAPMDAAHLYTFTDMPVYFSKCEFFGMTVIPACPQKDTGFSLVRQRLFYIETKTIFRAAILLVGGDIRYYGGGATNCRRLCIITHACLITICEK